MGLHGFSRVGLGCFHYAVSGSKHMQVMSSAKGGLELKLGMMNVSKSTLDRFIYGMNNHVVISPV